MQEWAQQGDTAPMDLERPLHYRRKRGIDREKGWTRRCLCTHLVLEDLSHSDNCISKWSGGPALFHFSREEMLGVGKSRAMHKAGFGRELLTSTDQNKCRDIIEERAETIRRWASERREVVRVESSNLALWSSNPEWQENV